jgi:hemolysin III
MTQYKEISRFSKKEEMANALSHFVGALLGTAGLVLLTVRAARYGDGIHIVSSVIFGASMIILYLSSTMTHYLEQGRIKNFFFSLDKIAIYLLIAGTYTPLALVTIQGALGWTIFGIEWACAAVGAFMVLRNPVDYEKGVKTVTVFIYVAMGWLILIAIVPVIRNLPAAGWMLIFIGGALYSAGIYFYRKCSFTYHHLVWHLLVIAGTTAHYFAIYLFVLPG